jgi:hypothetical protein
MQIQIPKSRTALACLGLIALGVIILLSVALGRNALVVAILLIIAGGAGYYLTSGKKNGNNSGKQKTLTA